MAKGKASNFGGKRAVPFKTGGGRSTATTKTAKGKPRGKGK